MFTIIFFLPYMSFSHKTKIINDKPTDKLDFSQNCLKTNVILISNC